MKVHINKIDLAYSDEGQGQPVVFLHAFPLNRTMWNLQADALKNQFRVITVDLRGHGESDAPMWRYTLEQFADDIISLLQHLQIPRATFVGLSMGGYILFALYRKYPKFVRALVLADTRAQADTPEGKATRFSMAQVAYRRGSSAIAELMLPKLLSPSGMEHNHELVGQLKTMIVGNQISGIVGDLMAMEERPDATPLAQTIEVPTLVIVGEQDIPSPPEEVEHMANHIPGATFIRIPKAGHLSNMENPQAFNAALQHFLEQS
ncbi:alpha/beta fold hydrolase [Candidatus Nitronereus thalassa]|uniref:Alpha/beta fold hydrolase n=1 Tax=Candidatus Nitronereus thalassa TaxID=3020898 RepID=A0ABU3K755_9BACT|nr:alpha/beta fold hydrolase [Candidatus Nitronereus thalassa]MDT7042225.1 alpha/beta fold hydrolase [Candidatus Nitronereus thalassa]